MNWHIPPSSSFSLSLSLCVSPQRLDALPLSLDVAEVYSLVVALTFIAKCTTLDAKSPENNMPLFPINDPSTWSLAPPKLSVSPPSPSPLSLHTPPLHYPPKLTNLLLSSPLSIPAKPPSITSYLAFLPNSSTVNPLLLSPMNT